MRLAACLSVAASVAPVARGQGLFDQLQELQAAGEISRALEVANACDEPLQRAQARLFVLHHAGDLAGALTAGLDGLRAAPEDMWLLERSTTLALDLGATELALELLPRFEAQVGDLGQDGTWSAQAADLRSRTDARTIQIDRVRRSLTRARTVAALAGLMALACLVWACSPRGARASQEAPSSGAHALDP